MFGKLFGRKSPEATNDEWSVGTMEVDGQPVVVRFLARLPDNAVRDRLNHLVEIVWPYASELPTGMPSPSDLEAMAGFEEAIDVVEADRSARLAVVFTGAGNKTWRYFTSDPGSFAASFSEALRGHPVYPIQLQAWPDREWEGLKSVTASAGRA